MILSKSVSMTLRKKTLLIISVINVTLLVILSIASRIFILASFDRLEERHTKDHVERIRRTLFNDYTALDAFVFDWATWDDTYEFIKHPNEEYLASNLVDKTFVTPRLNLILFINAEHHVVFGKGFDLNEEQEVHVPQSLLVHLSAESPLFNYSAPQNGTTGILLLPEGPMLVASRPILTSDEQGPIRGSLLMGRYLNTAEIDRLAEITQHPLTMYRFDDPQLPSEIQQKRALLSKDTSIAVQPVNASTLAGYTLIDDIYGNPALVLQTEVTRDIYRFGQTSVRHFIIAFFVTSVLVGAATLFVLEKVVISRLAQLSERVNAIRTSNDLSTRVTIPGEDELSSLSGDITEMLMALKLSQKELKENERQYSKLIQLSFSGIIIHQHGQIIVANIAGAKLLGAREPQKIIGKTLCDFIHPDCWERFRSRIRQIQEQHQGTPPTEEKLIRLDGKIIDVEMMLIPVLYQQQPAEQIAFRDITKRKGAETALKESEERYRRLVENAPLGILTINTQGQLLDANPMLAAILGAPLKDDICTLNVFTSPQFAQTEISEDFHRCLISGSPQIAEKFHISEWGKEIYLSYYLTPIYNEDRSIVGVQAIVEDITERKLTEKTLREHEAEYRSLFKNLLNGLFYSKVVVDENNRPIDYIFLEINEAFEHLIGFGREIIGKRATEVVPEIKSLEPDLIRTFGNVALTGRKEQFDFYFAPFESWFAVSAYSPEKGYFIALFDDITERKWAEEALRNINEQLEQRVEARTAELQQANRALQELLKTLNQTQEQLVQSQKMAALGGLVAGVAHEINTPLGVAITAISYLEQETQDILHQYQENTMRRSDLERYMETTSKSTKMILGNLQNISRQIEVFKQVSTREARGQKRAFQLKNYIEGVLLNLAPTLKKTPHKVTIDCPEDLILESYPTAFSQILTNFVMNSLIHGFENQFQGEINVVVTTENNGISLKYSDNGRGMTEEECSKSFDPFYTTKRTQGGSGLGLHIVYNLVTQLLKGKITCESTPGKGSTFIIQLPL